MKEALNNAIKYANLDLIHIFLGKSENNKLILEIKDDGIGFNLENLKDSNNLLPYIVLKNTIVHN